ncbi:MAG TPA: hypothetical protein ENN61_03740, partial [Bacteroidaceae bacterium]|nr:hypothetical protein [Bacteroidaceae bacterium]
MITAMKKYSFLVYHGDYHDFLRNLGKLGVVHVIEREDINKEESLKDDREYLDRLDKAIGLLNLEKKVEKAEISEVPKADDVERSIMEIEATNEEILHLNKRLEDVHKEIERVLPWGDYDREDLAKVKGAGYTARLYQCTSNQFDPQWEEQYHLFMINSEKGKKYFMILEKEGEETDINAEIVEPGRKSLSGLKAETREIKKKLGEAEIKMQSLKENAGDALMSFRNQLENEIAFNSVVLETQKASGDKLRILEGWVPEVAEEKLNEFLKDQAVVSLVNPPSADELPPVRLRNSWFARLFEPISKLFDLPSYHELDLTPFFAPFFMLFFGFCLGDAGYGLFFIIVAGLAKLKVKKDFKPILTLAQFLGIGTVIFGLISGTFFGINLIDTGYTVSDNTIQSISRLDIPADITAGLQEIEGIYFKSRDEYLGAIQQYIGPESLGQYQKELLRHAEAGIPFIRSFRHLMQSPLHMFYLSMLIGGLQILFGIFIRVMNVTRQRGFKYALSPLGWFILIITLILYFLGVLQGNILQYVFYGLLAISGVMIFLLNKPDINVLARVGSGIWDSYNMITGVFGDLLS